MLQHIQQYYIAEKQTAFYGITVGFVFMAVSFITWKFTPPTALSKGLAIGLLVAGSVNLLMTIPYAVITQHKIVSLNQPSRLSDVELRENEISRMEKVFNSSFKIALCVDSAIILAGIILVMANTSFLWKGVGLSMMILGTAAFTGEGFSMQKNRAYQQKITNLKF
jgi:tetrahydromethanopterin S-methyltransferase subunit F